VERREREREGGREGGREGEREREREREDDDDPLFFLQKQNLKKKEGGREGGRERGRAREYVGTARWTKFEYLFNGFSEIITPRGCETAD